MECVMCKSKMEHGFINHISDINKQIIIIKNVPAIICSQCGESYLEHTTAVEIENLIDDYLSKMDVEVLVLQYHKTAA